MWLGTVKYVSVYAVVKVVGDCYHSTMHNMSVCMHLASYVRCNCHKFRSRMQKKFYSSDPSEVATLERWSQIHGFVTLTDARKQMCLLL